MGRLSQTKRFIKRVFCQIKDIDFLANLNEIIFSENFCFRKWESVETESVIYNSWLDFIENSHLFKRQIFSDKNECKS